MIYYMIRHKATGEFMPELKRTRGYTHWNPSTSGSPDNKKLTGCPRLFPSFKKARRCIAMWNSMPNAKMSYSRSYDGEEDYSIDFKSDGRKKEDLEVVIVDIVETGVIKP